MIGAVIYISRPQVPFCVTIGHSMAKFAIENISLSTTFGLVFLISIRRLLYPSKRCVFVFKIGYQYIGMLGIS